MHRLTVILVYFCVFATAWADSATLYLDFKNILAENKVWAPECPKSYQKALKDAPHKRQIHGVTYGLFLNCTSRRYDMNTRVTGTRYYLKAKRIIKTEAHFREFQERLLNLARQQIAELDQESKGEAKVFKTTPDKWDNWGERIEIQYSNSRINVNFELGLMREINTPEHVFYESETVDFVTK